MQTVRNWENKPRIDMFFLQVVLPRQLLVDLKVVVQELCFKINDISLVVDICFSTSCFHFFCQTISYSVTWSFFTYIHVIIIIILLPWWDFPRRTGYIVKLVRGFLYNYSERALFIINSFLLTCSVFECRMFHQSNKL